MQITRPVPFVLAGAFLASFLVTWAVWPAAAGRPAGAAQDSTRAFRIRLQKYEFVPARIEVQQNDLVKITIETEDIPHSFTIDDYRISKRVNPGQTVVFEFRADKPGTFPYYCSLTIDEGCRNMRGELVVRPR